MLLLPQVEYEYFGEMRREELKPGGAGVAVTAANRAEFVALMTDYYLTRSIAPMFSTFSAGFHEVRCCSCPAVCSPQHPAQWAWQQMQRGSMQGAAASLVYGKQQGCRICCSPQRLPCTVQLQTRQQSLSHALRSVAGESFPVNIKVCKRACSAVCRGG